MKRFSLLIATLIGILMLTSCERKYYTITKDELNAMERRVTNIETCLSDIMDEVSVYSDAYSNAEEAKEQADALINDIGNVFDADRNN